MESRIWLPASCPGGERLGFKTELINDLVSLSCKKTGNVFQGHKFSQTFKGLQWFIKPKECQSPLGLARVMDICGVCKELFQAVLKASSLQLHGLQAVSLY